MPDKMDPSAALRSVLAYPDPALLFEIGRWVFAAAFIGLAMLGLIFGDFALQWQPVPENLPARTLLAYATALGFAALAVALVASRFRALSASAGAIVFLLWAFALHGPAAIAAPTNILPWLAFCEILAVACGLSMLAARLRLGAMISRRTDRLARYGFGACLPVFGLSHFAYIQFTADMIPAWIPFHLFWAWFTGGAHVAAGVSILTGVLARLGALLFAVMVSGFVLLLHVPRVLGEPSSRQEWTMIVMAGAITAAAWCAAASMASTRTPQSKETRHAYA